MHRTGKGGRGPQSRPLPWAALHQVYSGERLPNHLTLLSTGLLPAFALVGHE
jgi:hypothetical protein